MPTYRSAGILHSGAPVFHKFPSDNLVKTLRLYNLEQYSDYELYLCLENEGKEQLLLEIDNYEVTYGGVLYDQAIDRKETNVIYLPATTIKDTLSKDVLDVEIISTKDVTYNHRKTKLNLEEPLLCQQKLPL